jgi:hypothetical protein
LRIARVKADATACDRVSMRPRADRQTQRYLNVTDEELQKGLEVSWKRRTLKVVGGQNA